MSYQKVPHENYPGYGTGYHQPAASAPPQPPRDGYPYPPPTCYPHPAPPASGYPYPPQQQGGGYQAYFDQGYPPHHHHHHCNDDGCGCFSFIRGCLAALCCCCLLEGCF